MAIPPKPIPAPAKQPEDALQRSRREREELEGDVQKLEEELEELKVKYEMYFLGVEKREPNKWREELKKKVLRIKEAFTRNAALRFRLQSLHARFLSYERLWLRSAKEKEEGTYHRDVFKAKMHQEVRARRDREEREARAAEEIAALSSGLLPPRAVSMTEPPAAAAPSRPPAGTPPFSYQWRRNGVDIPGATGAVLHIAAASALDAGQYAVEARNAAGAASSSSNTNTVAITLPDTSDSRSHNLIFTTS